MRKIPLMLLPTAVIVTLALPESPAAAVGVCSRSTPQYCPTPTVATGTAANIESTSATVSGTVNPNGAATTCAFGYGTTIEYGETTPLVTVPGGTTTVTESAPITGLTAGTTYHYEFVCGNGVVLGYGGDKTVTAAKPPPQPKSKPKLKTRTAKVSKLGVVKLTVNCSNSTACKGKLSVTLKRRSLGKSVSYSIKPQKSNPVSFKLAGKALKQLEGAKHDQEKVSVALKDADKGSSSGTVTFALET
jgi:hypothetical protein